MEYQRGNPSLVADQAIQELAYGPVKQIENFQKRLFFDVGGENSALLQKTNA